MAATRVTRPLSIVFVGLALLGFTLLIVQASLTGSVLDGLRDVVALPWGLVTLVDLGIGLVFAATWITALVGWRRALPWIVALALTGNLALLAFVMLRFRRCHDLKTLLLQPLPPR